MKFIQFQILIDNEKHNKVKNIFLSNLETQMLDAIAATDRLDN